MDTSWLHHVVTAKGPFASVHVDATHSEATSAHELELRWEAAKEGLQECGAPEDVVAAVGERVLRATGLAGEQSRSVVATADGVLLDRVLPRRPARDVAHYGPLPHLVSLVRAAVDAVPYVLVEVDHVGADVTVVDAFGHDATHQVEGGHDVLHKVPGGGWSQRRYQSRVEDSWDRNAGAVAKDLDRVVSQHRPELVVLTGDPRSRSALRDQATGRVGDLIVDVEHGGRAEGQDEDAERDRVQQRLTEHRQARMGDVLARYEQENGRDGAAASGLAGVVEVLREGAVETLLLADDPSSTDRLWAGEDPMQLGLTADEVTGLGATEVYEDRADAVLLRALIAQSGSVELIEGADVLDGGVGALLRFDIRPERPGSGG